MSLPSAFRTNVLETQAPVLVEPANYELTRKEIVRYCKIPDPLLVEHLDQLVPGLVLAALYRYKLDRERLVEQIQELRDDAKTEFFLESLTNNSRRFKAREICLFDLSLIALQHVPEITIEERIVALSCLFDPINAIYSRDANLSRNAASDLVLEYTRKMVR